MPTGWDSKTASGRSSFGSGRSGTGPGLDIEVDPLEEAGKPVEFIIERGFTDISRKTLNTPSFTLFSTLKPDISK